MTIETDFFRRAGVDSAETDEQARRAVKQFRAMQSTLTAYARVLTKRPDVRVEMAARDNGSTDGSRIYYRPPMSLGSPVQHDRRMCDKRDENKQSLCPACAVREEVLVTIYHEIAHICFDTFAQPTDSERKELLNKALSQVDGKYADKVKARVNAAPAYQKRSYLGMAALINQYLPIIVNSLEDARVNRELFKARKGVKSMFDAEVWKIFKEGVEQKKSTGEVVTISWTEYPLNSQVIVGLFCKASGYDYANWFAPKVVEALGDETITNLLRQLDTIRSASGVYNLSLPILVRLRELGFCQTELDVDESNEDTEDEEKDSGQEGQQDERAEDGDEEGQGEGTGGAGDPSSEADRGGEDLQDEGSDQRGNDSREGEGSVDEEGTDGHDDSSGEVDPADSSGSGAGDSDSEPEEGDSGAGGAGGSDGGDGAGDDDVSAEGSDVPEEGSPGSEEESPGSSEGSGEPVSEGDTVPSTDPASQDDLGEPSDPRDGDDSTGDLGSEGNGDDSSQSVDDSDASEGQPSSGGSAGSDRSVDESRADSGDSVSPDGEAEHAGLDGGSASGDDSDGTGVRPEDGTGPDESDSTEDAGGDPERSDVSEAEGDPIDTGADDGQGGTEVIEDDSLDDLPYGTPEDAQAGLLKWGNHEDKPKTVQEKNAEAAVDRAIVQGIYFETPSRTIYGVREHKFGEEIRRGGMNMSVAWDHDSAYHGGLTKRQLGIEGDFTPPESILGPALLRMRVAFSDNQRGADLRNRKSGKVDGRVLGKRAYHRDERIFKKRILPGKKNYFVLIGMDVSGSTVGKNIVLEKEAVFAQAELLGRMGIPFAIFAHSGNYHDPSKGRAEGLDLDIYLVKEVHEPWDSKAQEKLSSLGPDSANLDGHTLEYYRKVLDSVDATDKIILYYTDGKMPAENHDEELEILQREIRICKQKGYTLLGVGIRTDSPVRHGLDTVQVDGHADVVKVVKHLEKRLLAP